MAFQTGARCSHASAVPPRAAGHQRRAESRAFLAAAHPGADETQALGRQLLLAPDRVEPTRIAAVDDDVALVKKIGELSDHRIGRRSRLDHDHRLARTFQRGDEFLDRLAPDQPAGRVGILGDEFLGFARGAVEHRDAEAVVGDVESQILAHDGKADEADVGVVHDCFGN